MGEELHALPMQQVCMRWQSGYTAGCFPPHPLPFEFCRLRLGKCGGILQQCRETRYDTSATPRRPVAGASPAHSRRVENTSATNREVP
jgi:hypothetical protein